VHEGEVDEAEALTEANRLSGADVCLDETFSGDQTLPRSLRSLLDRSFRLYQRIARIEQQMVGRLN
jgi:regulator of CtrA degradation